MEEGDVELGERRTDAATGGAVEEAKDSESKSESTTISCEACLQSLAIGETTELVCGTRYCRGCLRQLVEYSMKDVSLFPPRCCRVAIDPSVACLALDSDEDHDRFRRMYTEASSTVMYCPKPACATAIILEKDDDDDHDKEDDGDDKKTDDKAAAVTRTCPGCGAAVCTRCRREAHPGKGCPKKLPVEEEAVLRLARRLKWKRCPRCRHLIELNRGCNHITCVCGYELCFKCGGPWWSDGLRRQRHCRCVLWEVENIVHQRANNDAALRCIIPYMAYLVPCTVYLFLFCFGMMFIFLINNHS